MASCSAGGTTLQLKGEAISECQSANTEQDWQRLLTTSTSFGLDYFTLSPSHGTVTVTKVELIDASPGFQLTQARFVPGGGVGNGWEWGTKYADEPAASLSLRRSLPARLNYTPLPPGVHTGVDGSQWELAVGVSLGPSAAAAGGGYAKGVRVTYRSGGSEHTIDGADAVGVIKDSNDCDKYLR
jgi:hypothetical protein